MKKIIIAAALVLTTGIFATNAKTANVVKAATTFDKNVIATAD